MLSWEAWARMTPVAQRGDRIYLIEIARYADARGVAKICRADLAAVIGASPRTISRHLTSLENSGLLTRDQTRMGDGNFGRIRIQLTRTTATRATAIPTVPANRQTITASASTYVEEADDDVLRTILTNVAAGTPGSKDALGGAISFEGPGRFRSITAKRHPHGADSADTISIAYEIAVANAGTLAAARSPWALLATYVRTRCQQIDQDWWAGANTNPLPEGDHIKLEEITPLQADDPTWGIDEIEDIPELGQFVAALKNAGMNPTLAETGTAIVLSYLNCSASHRHELISHDKTLHALGIQPAHARAWLTAIAGSRRGNGGLAKTTGAQLDLTAQALTQAITPHQYVA